MDKKTLTNKQYEKIANHVVKLSKEGSFEVISDWYNLFDFVLYIGSGMYVSILLRLIYDGKKVVLTEDEYKRKEYGWEIVGNYCTIMENYIHDKEGNDINIQIDRNKLESLIEQKILKTEI